MRIIDLDLDRYGPFTGRRLAFRPEARLHVVFGRNEAGKSSSLAAVTDLLFGIERQTRFDFVHAGKEMRLGATIRDRSGASLAFHRRKLKPILAAPDGTVLPEDALAPFLGGLTREVFRRAFGLDAEALRRSGEDLERTDGELGGALLAAASGLRGFGNLQKTLEKEAGEIFAPRASRERRFYQALARYDAARTAIREKETRAGQLKALREDLERQDAELARIVRRRSELAVEQARLQRLKRAAPVLRAIDALESRLATLDLPDAPHGLGDELVRALEACHMARQRREDVAEGVQDLGSERETLAVDEAVLAQADAIGRLLQDSGAYQKARQDLPRVQAEADKFTGELEDIAVRLGLGDAHGVTQRRPDDAAQARLAAILDRGRTVSVEFASRRADLEKARRALVDAERARAERGALRDPRSLRERLAALAPVARSVEQRRQQAAGLAAEERALGEAAARLSPAIPDLERLASVPLPSRETIAHFRQRFTACDEAVRRENEAVDAAQAEAARLEQSLSDLSAGGPVPTAERIAESRADRDAAWQRLRASLFAEPGALEGGALASAVATFEAGVRQADALADAAAQDAGRVESHAAASRNLARQQAAAQAAQARLDEARRLHEAALAEWVAAWSPAGIRPGLPGEMASWLDRVDVLLERRSAWAARAAEAGRIEAEASASRPILHALSLDLGLDPMPELAWDAEAARIATEIERVAGGWDAARELDARIAMGARAVADAEKAEASAAANFAQWQSDLAEAVPAVGLPPGSGAEEAAAALAAWRLVPAIVRERADRLRRAAGIRRDAQRFESDVAHLVELLGDDLPGGSAEGCLRRLNQRLEASRDAKARREETEKRLAAAQRDLAEAGRALEDAEARLHALAVRLDLPPDVTVLAEVARGLVERDALRDALGARRDELANAADGREEASLRAELSGHDLDGTEGELARLSGETDALDHASRETYAARSQAVQKLEVLDTVVDAEVALQQRRSAEAEMLEAARDWVVLSVGATMIGTAIERRRSAQQGPLLARAGALFRTLTGASYEGLAQSYDEDDAPRLVGRRANGAEVAVAGMSEGTRDQLYLALRLAYLEDYATRAEPAPFVGDDLFSSFDDERTAHGLAALAAIGGTVQPILFTHHRFVVDAAMRELGEDVDIVDL